MAEEITKNGIEETYKNLYVLLSRTKEEIAETGSIIRATKLQLPRKNLEYYLSLLKLREDLEEILGIAEIKRNGIVTVP